MLYTQGLKGGESAAERALSLAQAHQAGVADEFERTKLLADAYWTKAMAAGSTGQYDECNAAIEKMIAVSEAYARAHPDESRSYEALASAYANAGIIDDPRKSGDELLVRSIALTRKALVTEEKLIALHPNDASYVLRAAESRFNLGDSLASQGKFREALEQLALATPVLAARAADESDVRAQLVSLMTRSVQGWVQFNLGQVAEAEKGLLASEQGLIDLVPRYDNLQVTFHLGQTRTRLGAVYIEHASRAGLPRAEQLEHWRKARDWLTRGKADLEKVRAAVEMGGSEEEVFRTGVANLAKAEAAIARLSGASR
jgi:tetratricopeptide (TPR) repeat protein